MYGSQSRLHIVTACLRIAWILHILLHWIQARTKAKGIAVKPSAWVKLNTLLCKLFFPEEDSKRLVATPIDEWHNVEQVAMKTCNGSALGKALFGFGLPRLIASKIHQHILLEQVSLIANKPITLEAIEAAMDNLRVKFDAEAGINTMNFGRECSFDYRGFEFKVKCKSPI